MPISDTDELEQLLVHIIQGVFVFAKIKMEKSPRVGQIGQPLPKLTKMGWVMMTPVRKIRKTFFSR